MPSRHFDHSHDSLSLALSALLALSCTAQRAGLSPTGPASVVAPSDAGGSSAQAQTRPEPDSLEPAPKPWTDAFMSKAALVADRVLISGPKGLLDHTVVQQDLEHFDVRTETTPEGFRQATSIRPEMDSYDPIRAQVDALQIMALREVVLLERPGPVDVKIVAGGDVYYHDIVSAKERHTEELVLEGPIARAGAGDH